MQRANPRGGWSSSSRPCPTWPTARAEAGTPPLNPPPLTFSRPRRWRCQTTRRGAPTAGSLWWNWQETLPSLGGAVRPQQMELGCSKSSTTAQGMTRWSTGWSVLMYYLCFFFFVFFQAVGFHSLALVLRGVIKVSPCVAECVPACVWEFIKRHQLPLCEAERRW